MAIIEIAHGHITVADLNDGHTPSIDVDADGRLVIDGVPKGPSLKGEDAEAVARYEIQPSENSIMRDFKGALTPATLTARVFRDTGIAMEEVTPGGSNVLRYSIDWGTEQTYSPASGIATGGAKQKITLNFYVGAVRWASLDVPVHGIRAQLDSSGNLTIGEAVVNVKGPKPVLSLNAQHQLVADGVLVSDTVLKGTDGITPEIDPTTKRWKIGGTLTQVKAEGTDGQPGTPGTPGKDFKYSDFTAAQLDALQSGVKSKIDTSTFRSDIGGLIKADVKTLLKNDSGFVALTKGEPGTPGTNGTNGKDGNDGFSPYINSDNKWVVKSGVTNVLAKGVDGKNGTDGATFTPKIEGGKLKVTNSKTGTVTDLGQVKGADGHSPVVTLGTDGYLVIDGTKQPTLLKGADGKNGNNGSDGATFTPSVDASGNLSWSNNKGLTNPTSRNIKGIKGDTGPQGFGVKVVEWVGSTTLATAKGWVGKANTYTCKSSDTLTALRVGDTVHILTVLSDQGSKKGYVVGTCSQKSGTQVSVVSVGAFIFGDKGDKGDKPVLSLNSSYQLVADGTVVSTLSLRGPQGTKGDTGPKGATGANGLNWAAGKMLYTDPTFATGNNGCNLYNNASNGVTTVTRATGDWPNDSGYGLVIRNTGAANPELGGFTFYHQSKKGRIYVLRLVANIPTGHNLYYTTNAVGSNGTFEWFTPQAGTGFYREYVVKVTCGWTGTFSTLGFFYIDGAPGSSSSPLYWYVSYATIFDITETDGYVKSISNALSVANSKLTQAQVDARVVAGVPAWARASAKPTYAYTEITGRITKVSELTNDSGYQTSSQVNTIINGKGFATTAALNSGLAGKANSSDTPRVLKGLVSGATDYAYIKIGTLPVSSSSTYDSMCIKGSIGGWLYSDKCQVDITISGRGGIEIQGKIQGDFAYMDIGVNDSREVFLISKSAYTAWNLVVYANQSTIEYTGARTTPKDTTWLLLSNSNVIVKYNRAGEFLGNATQYIKTATFITEKTALQTSIAAKLNSSDFTFAKIGGTATAAQIPNLDASKITAGTFGADRIPNLNASKITAGTLVAERIPTLPIAKVSNLQTTLDGKCTLAQVEAKGYKNEAGVKALLTWSNVANKPTLFSGKYSDLTGRPTIPSKVSELTNDSGYLYLSNGCVTDTAGTCSVLPYAAKSHTHTGYASSSHNHDTVYAAKSHKHNTLEATYSGSGGKQPPNYIGYNSLRSCMSNEEVNGNTQYKNWIYINAYSGADVGGTTAIGFNRQTMAAYLMRSEANASTWAEKAELLGTHNFFICHMLVRWTSSAISSGGYKGSFPTSGLTRDANGFHFTANVDWGLTANGGNAFFIVNAIVTPIPITAYMAGNTVYVKWNGTLANNVRGNVSLTILRCP